MEHTLPNCLNRRDFLTTSTLGGISLLLSIQGCHTLLGREIIVRIVANTLEEMYEKAKQYFLSEVYKAGEILSEAPAHSHYIEKIDPTIRGGFKRADPGNGFCTPVVICQRGHDRYLQLPIKTDWWSLVSGGRNNSEVFQVHKNWLEWLLYKDNCNLKINGHSKFEYCGVNGCQVWVNRQKFLEVDGKDRLLAFIVEDQSSSASLERHRKEGHATRWQGCPEVKGVPEQCTF